MSEWSVILPETRTNFVYNPTGMDSGNYTAVSTPTITRINTSAGSYQAYFGNYYIRLETNADNEGMYFTLSALTNAIHYMTLRIHTSSDITPMFDCSLDNATYTTPTLLGQEGDFRVYGIQFPAAQANGSTKLYILQNGAGDNTIRIAHAQVELGEYATTPITGDRIGFTENGYYWNGEPNKSSSTRAANERSGGQVKDLADYNFKVTYGVGSGMPPILHHTQSMALLPGALYQGHKVLPRILDLVSSTTASTSANVMAARRDFINAVKPDRVSPEQPVVFRYSGNSLRPVEYYAFYDSGMEFNLSSGVVDQPTARFLAYDPLCYEVHTNSTTFTNQTAISNADYVVQRRNDVWTSISTDFNGTVLDMCRGVDGMIYIGGAFTNVGTGDGDYITKFDPFSSGLAALGTGMNNSVYALVTASNGDIYAGGTFTLAGGVAKTVCIAYWDIDAAPAVWKPLIDGITGGTYVYDLVFGIDGSLYVGGDFTNQGDGSGDYIVKWTGSAWASLSTGADGIVLGLAVAQNGDLYACGQFANIGGVAAAGIAKWNGTAWSALGAGLTGGGGNGNKLAIDKAGNVYVVGSFTAADGVSCANVAKWNGATFDPLGSGLNDYGRSISIDDNGLIYVVGNFTAAGGVSLNDHVAVWNGSTWNHLDINLPGTPDVYKVLPYKTDLYLGYNTAGTAYANGPNTVTNNGSTVTYPVIKLYRGEGGATATLKWIKNFTTGDTLLFNYNMLAGETLTLDLTPGRKSIKSNYFGDVWRALLRASDLSTFRLQPGANSIGVFINPTDAYAVCWIEWKLIHWGADQVAA